MPVDAASGLWQSNEGGMPFGETEGRKITQARRQLGLYARGGEQRQREGHLRLLVALCGCNCGVARGALWYEETGELSLVAAKASAVVFRV